MLKPKSVRQYVPAVTLVKGQRLNISGKIVNERAVELGQQIKITPGLTDIQRIEGAIIASQKERREKTQRNGYR